MRLRADTARGDRLVQKRIGDAPGEIFSHISHYMNPDTGWRIEQPSTIMKAGCVAIQGIPRAPRRGDLPIAARRKCEEGSTRAGRVNLA